MNKTFRNGGMIIAMSPQFTFGFNLVPNELIDVLLLRI